MRNDIKSSSVSIVVPLYKGNEYVKNIIQMIKRNYEYCKSSINIDVEIIFVNDFPEEIIDLPFEKNIKMMVIQRKKNGGIHAARVDGLMNAKGSYIIFFDQDDYVRDSWLYTLFREITVKECDAIVCNGWRSRYKYLYSMEKMHSNINDLNFYLDYGNAIVSPGQAIIKRKSIPEEWINNIKKINGCDDHLLWLIMLKKESIFGIVDEYLYYHNPGRHSYSISQGVFYNSYKENIQILEKEKLINSTEIRRMKKMAERFNDGSETKIAVIELITKLYVKRINGVTLSEVLERENIKTIAIYGVGRLGQIITEDLSNSKIKICYIIDREAEDFFGEYKVLRVNDNLQYVDMVIDTTVDGISKNEKMILHEKGIKYKRINNIVDKM